MPKFHVKKGDEVVVLAGAEKGKRGKINTGNEGVAVVVGFDTSAKTRSGTVHE